MKTIAIKMGYKNVKIEEGKEDIKRLSVSTYNCLFSKRGFVTLDRTADNVERWQDALQKAQTAQERLKRRLDVVTVRVETLKAKIVKNMAYKTYYERRKDNGKI